MTEETQVFLDTEYTNLNPSLSETTEVAVVVRRGGEILLAKEWFLPVTLHGADPMSLKVQRFHQRHPQGNGWNGSSRDRHLSSRDEVVGELRRLTHDATILGLLPYNDTIRLERLFELHQSTHRAALPSWRHRLVDVEAYAAGALGMAPPWSSDKLAEALGVTISDEERHTAIGDAHFTMRIYDAALERSTGAPTFLVAGDGLSR